MNVKIWKEALRRNREEGHGTSIPGRVFGGIGFMIICWGLFFAQRAGDGVSFVDIAFMGTINLMVIFVLGFGLSIDYREAKDALNETRQ